MVAREIIAQRSFSQYFAVTYLHLQYFAVTCSISQVTAKYCKLLLNPSLSLHSQLFLAFAHSMQEKKQKKLGVETGNKASSVILASTLQ